MTASMRQRSGKYRKRRNILGYRRIGVSASAAGNGGISWRNQKENGIVTV